MISSRITDLQIELPSIDLDTTATQVDRAGGCDDASQHRMGSMFIIRWCALVDAVDDSMLADFLTVVPRTQSNRADHIPL